MSSIGDVVHTFPAYMALRDAWPSTRFGWAVEPAAAALLERLPGALRLHLVDTAGWRRRLWRPATLRRVQRTIAELREPGYEIAIDFQGLLKSALVARLSGASVLGMSPSNLREPAAARFYDVCAPEIAPDAHVIARAQRLAEAAGAAHSEPRFPELAAEPDVAYVDEELARLGLERFAVLHAAANWPSKRWAPGRHAAVARGLHRGAGLHTVWVWGPGEEAQASALARASGRRSHVAFPTTLPQLAALLARAELFVGGDSAPLHLAVACGTPVVGIFGPTDPARLGSLDERDLAAVNRLPCSFCHRRRCPIGTRECMEDLDADAVLRLVWNRIGQPPGAARAS